MRLPALTLTPEVPRGSKPRPFAVLQVQVITEGSRRNSTLTQLSQKKETMTKLRFFLHETNGGNYGETFYPVVKPNISLTSPTSFRRITMFEDPLKVGPDPESEIVGRAQGSVDLSSFGEVSLAMTLNFVFTAGKYENSTLSVAGRNPLYDEYRELAVTGGSGVFRLARGIACTETTHKDEDTGDLIAEYNIFVIHYDTPSSASATINTGDIYYYSSSEM